MKTLIATALIAAATLSFNAEASVRDDAYPRCLDAAAGIIIDNQDLFYADTSPRGLKIRDMAHENLAQTCTIGAEMHASGVTFPEIVAKYQDSDFMMYEAVLRGFLGDK